MQLLDHYRQLTPIERVSFAHAIGTTPGHLRNMAYGQRTISALYASRIERQTSGRVTRQEMFPESWQEIWGDPITPNDERRPAGAVSTFLGVRATTPHPA